MKLRKSNVTVGVAKANEVMKAEGIGELKFEECKLRNVMVVPEVSANLLSVREMTRQVEFKGNKVSVKKDGKEVIKGETSEKRQYKVRKSILWGSIL